MPFPLGRPILVLFFAAIVSGLAILQRPEAHRADLNLWTFSEPHASEYRDAVREPGSPPLPSLADQFQQRSGRSVQIHLLGQSALDIRILSLFMSGATGSKLPDLCEIEIHSVGQYLRPPPEDIGLLPLNDFLEESGRRGRLIPSRLETMSKFDTRTGQRLYFGIPDDIHPVTLTYRKDLFDAAGLDPEKCETWAEFQACCEKLQQSRGGRHVLAVGVQNPDELMMMLLQRHINLVDEKNHPHFTDPEVLETTLFYTQLIAGPNAVGVDPSPGVNWTQNLQTGDIAAVLTPDWKAAQIPAYAPELAGKLRMMALPKFDPSDAPTSTLGGTFICIPRNCQNPELAWQLLAFFYLSPESIAARLASGDSVLPASPDLWNNPEYHHPDPFYAADGTELPKLPKLPDMLKSARLCPIAPAAGQSIGELYMTLAPQIPRRVVTTYSFTAELTMTEVLRRCVEYVQLHGSAKELRPRCQGWLAEAQEDLAARIQFGELSR
jgi:arabinosaccharide transport system substrate-binding protein